LAGLRTLALVSNEIGPAGARALAGSPHLAGLTELRLSGNRIRAEGARALLDSPHLAGVRSFGLYGALWGVAEVQQMVGLPRVAQLTGLDVGNCFEQDFNRRLLRALVTPPNLARLRSLGIGTNELRDEGARTLASSPVLARLTALDRLREPHRRRWRPGAGLLAPPGPVDDA